MINSDAVMKKKIRNIGCDAQGWLKYGVAVLIVLLASGAAWAERSVTVTYYHTDILGSVYATSDESGNVTSRDPYRPYGAEVGAAPDPAADPEGERHGYAGKQKDASGLIYFGARYYDPTLGRFMGIDPVGVDPANPHSFNRYTYANNNPYKYVDPDGRVPIFFAIPLLLKAVDAGVTAYDTYQAYRSEGIEGAAKELATAAAASVIPGSGIVRKAATRINRQDSHAPDFDTARRKAFEMAGLTDPSKVKVSKVDPKTGTAVEFKGPNGAKVEYDSPHPSEGPGHDKPHVGFRYGKGRNHVRGNITYDGPQHPHRSPNKGEGAVDY